MSARAALKAATDDRHKTLDTLFGGLDLSRRAHYAAFLRAQAAALLPYEAALDHAGAAQFLPDWPEHRRGPALLADLDALGEPLPAPVAIQSLVGLPDILGALYVLEGSRLGGTVIERSLPEAFPTAFLTHRPPLRWPAFVSYLEQNLSSPVDRAVAERAALRTFEDFTLAARQIVGAL